jgi:hypothetical protein
MNLLPIKTYDASRVPLPVAVGTDFVQGNDLTLMEKRMSRLQFSEPYFRQRGFDNTRVEKEPLRFSEHMTAIRSHEMTDYGRRRYRDTRKMKVEFTEKIKEIAMRQKREEEEARKNKKDKRARWWHRTRGGDQREPIKLLRYTNLTMIPESLLMSKDVVILQLTGARLGDAAMNWVGAFITQCYTLKRLVLQGNYITEEGVEHLVEGIRSSKSLMELDLSFNPIGDNSIELLCNALLENNKYSRLYLLNVSCCELTSNAGFQLGRMMHEFKHLQCLLAWRNQLGIANGATISGAGYILDELRHSPHMRLLNLTANNITDKEASDHAASLERATRRVTVANLERHQRMRHIEQLRAEVASRKAKLTGRNMEEKLAIHRLERQADQDQQKIDMSKKLEERQRTYSERQEIEFIARVKRQTGADIETKQLPCRVILAANSVSPITMRRLSRYYSTDAVPDAEGFVNSTRRYDNLIIPRRKIGEEHAGLREEDSFDPHNVLPWDMVSDPQLDYERRQALLQWKEEERIREEQMVLADFNKFAVLDATKMTPEERAKLGSGFNLASGVGSRVKLVQDPAKAALQKAADAKAEEERKARIRQQYGKAKSEVETSSAAVEAREHYQPKRLQDTTILQRSQSKMDGDGPIAIVVDPSGLSPQTTLNRVTNRGGVEDGEIGAFVEMDEAGLMQHKMNERMSELRVHLDQRSNRGSSRGSTPSMLTPTVEAGPLHDVLEAMNVIRAAWEDMKRLGEVGSPSDDDLRRREEICNSLVGKKQHLVQLLNVPDVSTCEIVAGSDVSTCIEQFLDDIIKETDSTPGNVELVAAMLDRLKQLPFSKITADRGLVAIAASDGSEQYFSTLLTIPGHEFDVGEVCAACFYNQTCRISLTLILLQFVDLAPYVEEVGEMLREFVADIASEKRSIPRENRILKSVLLKLLLSMDWLKLDVTKPGTDGQSLFTRALYEGDEDVVEMIVSEPHRVVDINAPLPDGSTALMQAVMGNNASIVQSLFAAFPSVDVSIRGENGNALDLAIGLSRDVKIVNLLRERGAQPSGARVDKDALSAKKIMMKVRSPAPSNDGGSRPGSS